MRSNGGDHALHAERVTAGYGRSSVLVDISMVAPKGKFTALAGPNGSGKSTLLAVLSRILKPSGGTALVDGQDVNRLSTREVARKLALLPQAPVAPEGLSVYDLVSRGRYPHRGILKSWDEGDEDAVTQALRMTGISDLSARPVDSLSGGQRQRCFIALALAQDTATILFDEPTTFLDLRYQVEVMELLSTLTRTANRTVIAVLHDLNAALQYADRIVFLKGGAIHHVVETVDECSAQHIESVFDTKVVAVRHPTTGRPVFLPDPFSGTSVL
ncbi:ABC transporter ATP-binding protein [Agrobacterium rubi]|uniref:ABC transporter ATP-binding protein n=1 Tax=Agrobacterium rubi TaxID=28099 RepID=A0AAE7RBF8_9HYPH|nr:ABC transporter ATP-binding protein [Agrobacterium rubi]NTE88267.1 ABC transporter ATP-binding protein [Agrobacterium rubi]NTF04033.1 ABC transporter ATP-binding protein [Agrobacterium rubi]NTF38364.1 ABC transporter ATP-binding protein [Agrobacterium rubi]OCJ47054.1 ABC transporter [Agrobacterium rubi]QTG02181.1 ABC transporter ATP-binding protein [Agrobacterium rubi]